MKILQITSRWRICHRKDTARLAFPDTLSIEDAEKLAKDFHQLTSRYSNVQQRD